MASIVIAIPKFYASSFVDRSLCVKKKLWDGSGVRFGGRRKTAAGSGGRGGDPVWSGRQRNLKTKKFEVQAQAKKGGSSGDKAPRYDPLFPKGGMACDCPVPWEQQPVNEYRSLMETWLFSWATDDVQSYGVKLALVGLAFAVLVGWPVTAMSFSPEKELMKCSMGALCGGILASTMAALRLYLGWAYVGNRLFSATVEYEETGWYDGQVWVKPPEVLARDRLLGSYKVKPALLRLKLTLIGLGVSLAACTALLLAIHSPELRVSLLPGEKEGNINQTWGLAYSDAAAQHFEPDAFAAEDDSDASAAMFTICH